MAAAAPTAAPTTAASTASAAAAPAVAAAPHAAAATASPASASSGDENRTKEEITEALLAALNTVKEHTNHEGFVTAMSTLTTLIGNLVDFPDDTRYKRVRLANGALKSRLFDHPGGIEAVK